MIHRELATFAAGCFWGVQAKFDQVPGVIATTVGYTGGHTKNPTYKEVCSDTTGHAEAVLVEFNPDEVTFGQLLDAFWNMHDPTTPNRQGPDIGSQYRSAIFYHSEAQREAAIESERKLDESGRYKRPTVTEIAAATEFWPAEDFHQKYYAKRGIGSCPVR